MKHKGMLFVFILVLPVLASCGGNKPKPTDLCTVTFNPNGGQIISGPSSIQVKPGTEFNQCSIPMARQIGKVFKDWTFDAEGTTEVQPTFKINQNVTFYAHLTDKYHTVTFNANGGRFIDSLQTAFTVKEGTKLSTINIPVATDDSSTYVGWATDAIGDNSVTKDYLIESDITLYAQYSNVAMVVDEPEDNEILCYGSTAIGYHLYDFDQSVVASCSKTGVLNVSIDSAHSSIIVDATNKNVEGSADVTVGIQSQSTIKTSIINVRHPESIQEAGECFDYALGRNIYNVTVTFDYNNQETLENFFNDRIETRLSAPYMYNDYEWNKGINKTNRIHLESDNKMATKSKDISQSEYSQYYYKNLKNGAYELRHSKIKKRTDGHFAIDDAKKRLVVHNSETLFFALERGFRPEFVDSEIAIAGSLANRAYYVYQEARNACAEAFGTETIDDLMKVRQLFEYLIDKTHYDHWIVSEAATEVENFWQWTSYFAEGVFLNNGIAVCDGFSKALVIMGAIEGLPIIRSAGFVTYQGEEGESLTSGHAWNYYHHSDGEWYLICPTWAHDDCDADEYIDYNYSAISYQPFMAQSNYFYNHIYKTIYNYCIDQKATEIEAKAYAEAVAQESNYKEVLFTDITKSDNPLVDNIYKTDVFDKNKGYDFDLNSDAEAKALGNALPIMHEDFSINLSFGSLDYLKPLYDVIASRMNPTDGISSADYSYTNCNIVIKF